MFNYDSDRFPVRIFSNHLSCKPFAQLISDTLLMGPSLYGYKVGQPPSHHLVMPLTVDPSNLAKVLMIIGS